MLRIPNGVTKEMESGDLSLYHYDRDVEHPGRADKWKGLVLDGNTVVACSNPWSPTVVTDQLISDQIYTPMYEATLIRFYRHNGKPMMGTHRKINIDGTNSRVGNLNRKFTDLVKEAISQWDHNDYVYDLPHGGKGYAYTPNTWEDLCIDGWCHVFLLLDISNQITDLTNLTVTTDIYAENGEYETITTVHPKLIHAISFQEGREMNEDGIYPMTPISGSFVFDKINNRSTYQEYRWNVPQVETMSYKEAEEHLADGGAVVGYSPLYPDMTTKYLSYEYAHKLELAGETFNPIHRWHQLMDINSQYASEYLLHLPWHMKHITLQTVETAHSQYINTIVNNLEPVILARLQRKDATLDHRVYNKVKPIIESVMKSMKRSRNRQEIEEALLSILFTYSYSEKHAIHGIMQRINIENNKQR